jgi:hypothetical protein
MHQNSFKVETSRIQMPERRREEFTPSKDLDEVTAQVEAIEQQIRAQ